MRRRLVGMVVAGSLAALLGFALPLAVTAKLLVESRLYGEAELRSRVVAAVLDEVGRPDAAEDALGRVDGLDDGLSVTIVFDDGRSTGAVLGEDQRDRASRAVVGGADAAQVRADGDVLLVTRFGDPGGSISSGLVVAVVPDQLVTRDLDVWWWSIGALSVVLFTVSVLLADRLGRSIVAPVTALVDASDALRRGGLDARVDPAGPTELRRLGLAFNLLADRIGGLVRLERDRVADLSHRLRTPITALHLQAESLADPADRTLLVARVERLEQELGRVLADARRVAETSAVDADLAEVCRERARFWTPLFEDQGRTLALTVPDDEVSIPLPLLEVASLVDELLGNAVTHTPSGTPVHLEVRTAPGGRGVLEVHDGGPGFPDGFAIARGRSDGGSSGLGLDIIRRTVEAVGGSVTVTRGRLGGATVSVSVPAQVATDVRRPDPSGGATQMPRLRRVWT